MPFDELVTTWFPVAAEISRTNGIQLVNNIVRAFGGGRR